VLRFSLGFGKVIYSRRFSEGGTEWVISAIPLGGYVKMVDEREEAVAPEDLPYAFNRRPVWQRILIVLAGPVANFLLAMLLYTVLNLYGVPGLKPVLDAAPMGSPAANAKLQAGETILTINNEAIPSWQDLRWVLLEQVLKKGEIKIAANSATGEPLFHVLDISSLEVKDLEGDFLEKLGLHPFRPLIPPVIGKLSDNSVAKQAGLQEGDIVLQADGVLVRHWMELVDVVRNHADQALRLDIRRGFKELSIVLKPQGVVESGKTVGKIGAAPKVDKALWQALQTEVKYGLLDAVTHALQKTGETTAISLKMMGKMLMGEISIKNLSGPITIADYAGQSAEMGGVAYFGFLALISISLGVLNLLPIPLLDGGHLLYYVAEWVKGSPVSELAWEIGQKIGITLIGLLMVFAIYNDINRLISG
jgi:regulator of sigma E protease